MSTKNTQSFAKQVIAPRKPSERLVKTADGIYHILPRDSSKIGNRTGELQGPGGVRYTTYHVLNAKTDTWVPLELRTTPEDFVKDLERREAFASLPDASKKFFESLRAAQKKA